MQDLSKEILDDQKVLEETSKEVELAVQSNPGTSTAELMTEKMGRVKSLYLENETLSSERQLALDNVLQACEKFWEGVEQLRIALKSVKGHLDTQDPPAAEVTHVEEQIQEHQVEKWISFL